MLLFCPLSRRPSAYLRGTSAYRKHALDPSLLAKVQVTRNRPGEGTSELGSRKSHHNEDIVDYVIEENRLLAEQMQGRRLRLTDDERRRLAVKAKVLGRKVLNDVGTNVLRLPARSPNVKADAESLVLSAKNACLNHMIFFGENALRQATGPFWGRLRGRGFRITPESLNQNGVFDAQSSPGRRESMVADYLSDIDRTRFFAGKLTGLE